MLAAAAQAERASAKREKTMLPAVETWVTLAIQRPMEREGVELGHQESLGGGGGGSGGLGCPAGGAPTRWTMREMGTRCFERPHQIPWLKYGPRKPRLDMRPNAAAGQVLRRHGWLAAKGTEGPLRSQEEVPAAVQHSRLGLLSPTPNWTLLFAGGEHGAQSPAKAVAQWPVAAAEAEAGGDHDGIALGTRPGILGRLRGKGRESQASLAISTPMFLRVNLSPGGAVRHVPNPCHAGGGQISSYADEGDGAEPEPSPGGWTCHPAWQQWSKGPKKNKARRHPAK
ncbi:hypothetical protein GQ53DRAFT_866225 [Thozetella sp. PMI_491]|nr:hypothetical protein GQ53DRAFT_866225 [Thozetella sp. PMI_491]